MKKRAMALMMAGILALGGLAGCGSGGDDNAAKQTSGGSDTSGDQGGSEEGNSEEEEGEGGAAAAADVISFDEIAFPEAMPLNPTLAEDDYYDYDDMSQHYDLTFFTYNYGVDALADDPIKAWLEEKYNVTLTLQTSTQEDWETYLSTAFNSGDVPDLVNIRNRDMGFTLGDQGLLIDAKEMYPYMPQTTKFVTQTILDWSVSSEGNIPFVTKYAVQDSDIWSLAIRQDWLDNLGMSMPTTIEEIKDYAYACTYNDPDGNGQDDTWFMTAAANGLDESFGMLRTFKGWFGNPYTHEENGNTVSPMLDGTEQQWITFLNELYDMGVLAPDWFTIEWEDSKAYTMTDKIGMVRYPAGALYLEYVGANNEDYSTAANWAFLDAMPEGTKAEGGGNPGNLWGIPKSAVEGDPGKIMRILHILDAMCYGGEAYFPTVQYGNQEVWADTAQFDEVREYTEDGYSYCYVPYDHPTYDLADYLSVAPWQNFGYTLKWQKEFSADDAEEDFKAYVNLINEANEKMANYDKWPNDSLLSDVDQNNIAPNLKEYKLSQQYKFIVGERDMTEWDDFVQEWLDKGGSDVLKAQAEKLGTALPDGIE